MTLNVLDVALDDLEGGFRFYELQTCGLGNYYLDSLWADMESLYIYAGAHSVHFGYYRLLSRRFPFAVYYKLAGEDIRIYAVLDCRQSPERIRLRLSGNTK